MWARCVDLEQGGFRVNMCVGSVNRGQRADVKSLLGVGSCQFAGILIQSSMSSLV